MASYKARSGQTFDVLRHRRLPILGAMLLLGLVYAAVPQLGILDTSWSVLLQSDRSTIALAVGFLLVSFAAAASIYHLLTPKKIRYGQTYLVQVAGAFAGKVLPVGLGSISVNYLYLRKRGCNQAAAATVVAVNNLLGFVGHGIWLLILALFFSTQIHVFTKQRPSTWLILGLAAGALVVAAVLLLLRKRFQVLLKGVSKQLRGYRAKPGRLFVALAASMLLTACNIAIVWLSASALHVPLTVVAAAVALTAGVLAQSATPTPGGLGGVEAGLVAGLALSGMKLEHAIMITIMFRLITFWLPLGLGSIALLAAMRQKLL
ncbi:hypothetical protein BH09PAT4_BH09PAT4_00470 [soil metagenome]